MFVREGTTASGGVLFWAVVFACIAVLLFGWYAPHFHVLYGMPVVDVEGALSVARTLELISAYGPSGRHDYLVFLSIDCVFPVAASLFAIAVFRALIGRLQTKPRASGHGVPDCVAVTPFRAAQLFLALPALAAVCDLVENTLEAMLALLYPRGAEWLAELALLATLAKLVALALTCAALLFLLGLSGRRWLVARA